jgi:hypothetical protein
VVILNDVIGTSLGAALVECDGYPDYSVAGARSDAFRQNRRAELIPMGAAL